MRLLGLAFSVPETFIGNSQAFVKGTTSARAAGVGAVFSVIGAETADTRF